MKADLWQKAARVRQEEITVLDQQIAGLKAGLLIIGGVAGAGLGAASVYSFIQGDVVFGMIFAGLTVVDGMIVFISF